MTSIKASSAIAILGGTFDPVHSGHLRLAIDLAEQLNLGQVRLMPGFQPVHRDKPTATPEQRLQMLRLAINQDKRLKIDDRELRRKGPSYTIISLQEIRAEIGADTPLYFILGEDAFSEFDGWFQWQDIIKYAHLLVARRPGSHPQFSDNLQKFIEINSYNEQDYPESPAGTILWMNNELLKISSSDIRLRLSEDRSINNLLPSAVSKFIELEKIYT